MSAPEASLLERSRQPGEQAAWERLVDLYSGHLFLWACRAGLQGPDAADLVRAVFAEIARKLPVLPAGAGGGFRSWMRGLAHAQRQELLRQKGQAAPGPAPAAADELWESEYLPFLLGRAVELLQGEFPPAGWQAHQAVAIEGRPAADVARELGITVAAVYAAEARVLHRLRRELDGLLD